MVKKLLLKYLKLLLKSKNFCDQGPRNRYLILGVIHNQYYQLKDKIYHSSIHFGAF